MITVSQEFQEALENGDRNYLIKIDINPPNLMIVKPFTSKTVNGITITYNADGSVILNGTADENGCTINVMVNEITLAADRYRLSGYPDGCSAETYTMKLYTKWENTYYVWTGYNNDTVINTTQRDNETVVAAQIVVQAGVTVSNLMFKPTLGKLSKILSFTKDNLISLSIEDAVSQDNKFTALGGAVINKATITIDNSSENYSTYDFKGATVTIKIGLQIGNSPEYIDRGVYIVDNASPKGIGLELSCLDYMSKFDKSYTESEIVYPATIKSIIDDACLKCGVIFTGTYLDSNYTLTTMPAVSTFRELLSAVGQITGTYAHVDRHGRLYFSWFNTTLLNQAINSDTKVSGVYYIEDVLDNNYEKDNITVNGIRAYVINDESNEKFEQHYPTTLTDNDFCLNITGSPLIHGGNITEIINRVGPRIVGLTIRQTKCKHTNNPLIEAGDVAMVLYSVKNNTNAYYPIAITRTTFAINQSQETVCGIETLSENLDGRYNDAQLLREQTKKDTNDAKKVATNYLSADTTGIMIADLADGTQTPSTATGRNVKIDNSFVYIRDGQTTIAQFGDVVTIGKTDGSESYQRLDYHSLQLIDKEGHAYFYVSDLRNTQGYTTFTEEHEYTSSATYISVDYIIYSIEQIIVNDSVELDYDYDYFYRQGYTFISWRQNTPGSTPHHYLNNGDKITVTYTTMDDQIKAYTLGVRKTNSIIGSMSFAEGYDTTASGRSSHAEGFNTTASGRSSHAEGFNTTAKGERSHSEGYGTTASGSMSHAEGNFTTASGSLGSHAEGYFTKASGAMSHAEGANTTASGDWSHVSGLATEAYGLYQTVIGRYNVIGTIGTQDYIFIMGNGSGDDARSNAFTVDWDGNVNIPSNASYQIGGVALDNRYVKKAGDTMTENLTVQRFASGDTGFYFNRTDTKISGFVGVGSGGTNHGVWSNKLNKWIIYADASKVYVSGMNFTDAASVRSSIGAVNKAGDTITGKLTLSGGLSMTTSAHVANPPYYLTLTQSFGDGGAVGYVSKAEMKKNMIGWTEIAQVKGANSATYSWSGYTECLLMIWHGTNYLGTAVFPTIAIGSTQYEIYIGGWGNHNTGSNRAGCAKVSNTKLTGVMVRVDNSDVTSSSYFKLYAR